MIDFSDKPYRYFPPRRNAFAAWLLGLYNRYVELPKKARIAAVQVSGATRALTDRPRGDRLLLVPNHPTHADAAIYTEALRRIGVSTHIMAAYDVFLRNRRHARTMQWMGCFSVDREGSDPQAMKQALRTLAEGKHALTVFPEGNVYLQNDLVTPFHEGAAFLGLRSAKTLRERGARVLAVPVSIKVTHLHDVRAELGARLHDLGERLGADLPADAPPLETVRIVGKAALLKNMRQRGLELPEAQTLPALIEQAADVIIDRLERKMDLKRRATDSRVERIRRARRAIHEIRLDEARSHDHAVAGHWADEAMLAMRVASYGGDYVESKPTIDRFAETIEKLGEDILGRAMAPIGPRHAFVRFAAPFDLSEYLDAAKPKLRSAARRLTEDCEHAVQEGLDRLNDENPHAGGRLWNGSPS